MEKNRQKEKYPLYLYRFDLKGKLNEMKRMYIRFLGRVLNFEDTNLLTSQNFQVKPVYKYTMQIKI